MSRQSAQLQPITKNSGDNIHLRCLVISSCHGTTYDFYYVNSHTGEPTLVRQGSHKLTLSINNFNGGEYYCAKYCTEDIASTNEHKCYWNIIGEFYIHCMP